MRSWLPLLPVLLTLGCGLTTQVRPVPRGALQTEAALGGPLVRLGQTFPVPLSTVGARYGIAEHVDVAAHAHLTSLAFGVAGLDVGGSWLALAQDGARPALSLGGRLYGFTQVLPERRVSPRAYLEVSPTVSYLFAQRFLVYGSATGFAQFAGGRPLWSLAVGEEVQLEPWGIQVELRWYEPTAATRFNTVEWVGVGGQGALGALLALRYRFGGAR